MTLRDKLINEIIDNDFTQMTKEDLESQGYDSTKFEAEGSIWIVYIYDCMRNYYQKNKTEIDNRVNEILKENIIE